MISPTEQEVIAAVEESMTLFAQRQGISPEHPTAEIIRKFSVGATLAILLMYDVCADAPGDGINWAMSASYNGIDFYVRHDPYEEGGKTTAAYEDDAVALMPLFLVGIRDVVMGTAVLGVAEPATIDSILSQTQIALAAIGPRLDAADDLTVTHALAVVYDRLKDATQAMLTITSEALRSYWQVKQHDAHARAVKEVMAAIEAWDAYACPDAVTAQ